MSKAIDIASIQYVGQLRYTAAIVGSALTQQLRADQVDALLGQGAANRLAAEHEARVEARRQPTPAKSICNSRYVTGYGRSNNSNPFPGLRGFGERI